MWETLKVLAAALPQLWQASGPWERLGWLSVVPLCLALIVAPKETVKQVGGILQSLVQLPHQVLQILRDLLATFGKRP